MRSTLFITPVDELQDAITASLSSMAGRPGIYVSLNKTQKSTEKMLIEKGIDVSKLFFIDCVTSEVTRDDVLHIGPEKIEMLLSAIKEFVHDIKSDKFLMIDAISTLLIYNAENKVAQFVKSLTELDTTEDIQILAFSPQTKGEELLEKIFNFFDDVRS